MKKFTEVFFLGVLLMNLVLMAFLMKNSFEKKDSTNNISNEVGDIKDEVDDIKDMFEDLESMIANIQINQYDSNANNVENVENKFPMVEIWADENNIIHRSGVENGMDSLGWVVLYNGEEVLIRNALGETQYEYYLSNPGVYTIYMNSWVGDRYRVISNVISYVIE